MNKENRLKLMQDRLKSLSNSDKNVKSGGVVRKLTRQIRNMQKEV